MDPKSYSLETTIADPTPIYKRAVAAHNEKSVIIDPRNMVSGHQS